MAEQDGRFDTAFGGAPAQMTSALRVALREEGTFLDADVIDLTTGQTTVAQVTISLHPPGTTLPPKRGDGLPGGAYAYYSDAEVLLPYLPDLLPIGVSLVGYDLASAEVFHEVAKFPGDWPALAPFRLRLSEYSLGAAFSGAVLKVTLPKAEVIEACLSLVFPDGRLEDLAICDWIPSAARTKALKKAALEGRHWMLTPFRWVTFTHAVQRPLAAPDMTEVTSARPAAPDLLYVLPTFRWERQDTELTVKGYSGRNIGADLSGQILHIGDLPGFGGDDSNPNTTVRAALQRRIPGIPGDLGWERVGKEISLSPSLNPFHVTWTGKPGLPEELETGCYRIFITEVETYPRDSIPGDPSLSTSRVDFVRERVVYADIFEL